MAQTRQSIKKIISNYISNLEALGISVRKVILFGSYAKGTSRKESDIDIAVISDDFKNMGIWERAKYLGRAARDIPYPIEVLGFSTTELKRIDRGTMLDEITRNGIEFQK